MSILITQAGGGFFDRNYPVESNVLLGVDYGSNNTEFEGTAENGSIQIIEPIELTIESDDISLEMIDG